MADLTTGLTFMLLGMGGVFLFLFVLVFVMQIMSLLLRKVSSDAAAQAVPGEDSVQTLKEEDEIRTAIAAAAAFHCSRGKSL